MESFLANLKHQVQCSLCNETLIEPKLLQCFHTFCKSCIKRHVQLTEQVNIFKCPQCTSQTLLQELNDVEDLQISTVHSRILQVLAFIEDTKMCSVSASHSQALFQCLDCDQSLCEDCLRWHSKFTKNHQVVPLSDLKKEDIEIMLRRECPCKTHDNQDVNLYCQDCRMLICVLCLTGHHHNHKTTSLQEFISTKKDFLSKNFEEIDKMSTDEKKKKQQEEIALLIKHDGEKAKEQVKKLTKKLVKALIDSEQQLLNEIQKSITKADKNLRIIRHTTEAQEYIKYFIENGTASEMIDFTRDGECSQNFTYNPFENRTNGIEFIPNEELCEQVKIPLGQVQPLFKRADPKMSSMKVEPSDMAITKKAKIAVELKTSEGEVINESLENVTIQFTPEYHVKLLEIQMTDDSEITMDFVPRVPGQLRVDIRVRGNHVSNSPLVMVVKPQQMKEMTGYSKLKDALNTGSKNFRGIAVNKTNSKIAVADSGSHCVRVFNMQGDLLLTYGNQGSGQGQLKCPDGLAFLNENNLVISDGDNHRICIVNTTTGKLVRTFGCHGNGQFQSPRGVHIDDDSNIIVCDFLTDCVPVFTKDGDYKYHFRVPKPSSTLIANGLLYFSNNNHCVVRAIDMKNTQSPTTVTTIGGKSFFQDYTNGQLQGPYGLAIDNDNNLLVCDNSSCLIIKFTLDGHYVGRSSKLTNRPWYIAVLNDGQVICTTEGGIIFLNN